jgi:hypothetical protein
MKKILLSLMFALSAVGFVQLSIADDSVEIHTKADLSEAQKADLAAQAAKMASENASLKSTATSVPAKVEVVKQWVDIGQAIGSGLAASAKELGIAANEFAQTPVGRFTVFLIAWHFIGSTLVHISFALLWLFLCTGIFVWIYRRASIEKTITYYDKGAGPNGATKVVVRTPKSLSENLGSIITCSVAVATIIFVIMLCNL